MKILFLSLLDFDTFGERNLYSDLLREFIKNGHEVCCISPTERRTGKSTYIIWEGTSCILKLKIGNIQKTNMIEKGISTLLIEHTFIKGIKKYFSDTRFDLVLYATPPITFSKVVKFVKERDGAKSYLMLKDIFPQNSVDLGLLSTKGLKGLVYRYFKKRERELYALSDTIGCMSQANCDYILKNYKNIDAHKVEICPNGIEATDLCLTEDEKNRIREKYSLPLDKRIFVYGGNLGKPQDVPYIIRCLQACAQMNDVYFVIAGSGTDRYYLERYIDTENPQHMKLFDFLSREEYDRLVACCDVGLIFLDYRFSIPNFPSRILSCMQASLPVCCCTDPNTDIGKIAVSGGFGWWCSSVDEQRFVQTIKQILQEDKLVQMGRRGYEYMTHHYSSEKVYQIIEQRVLR